MKDVIEFLYTDFLMRDFLGYLLPGAIIFFTFLYAFKENVEINSIKNKLESGKNYAYWVILLGFFYILGHSLSGICYNLISPNSVFEYYPKEKFTPPDSLKIDLKKYNYDSAFAVHQNSYIISLDSFPDSKKDLFKLRERDVALKQLTGTSSAALFVSIIILVISWYFLKRDQRKRKELRISRLLIISTLLVVAFGLYLFHHRLVDRQYDKEIDVINKASKLSVKRK